MNENHEYSAQCKCVQCKQCNLLIEILGKLHAMEGDMIDIEANTKKFISNKRKKSD